MNGGILPIALLFFAAGLAFAFASRRSMWIGIAAMGLSALFVSVMPVPLSASDTIFLGLWASVIASAGTCYSNYLSSSRWIILIGINNGAWAGVLAAATGMQAGMALAIPIALVAIPGRWIAARGFGIALKVVASWVIAIASLAIFVSLTPTPGYEPDHMG